MRYAIGVEYDGSCFQGWQSQPHRATVQDHLEAGLSAIAGCPTRAIAAGRTDAGVHALSQVVHFDAECQRPLQAWIRGVNAHLPGAIAVRWAVPVTDGFHARFSAISRSYLYIVLNHPIRPALQRGQVGWFHRSLNADLMGQAAAYLLGEHDFSSFRAAECQAKTPVKIMQRADVSRQGNYVIYQFRANGFLHHMVRNIVAALIRVGAGKVPPEWIAELLASRDRTRGAPTFAPDGLYFMEAEYDPVWCLPDAGRIMAPFGFFAL